MKDNHNKTTIWQTRINQNSMRLSARKNYWPKPSDGPARKAGSFSTKQARRLRGCIPATRGCTANK